ncbi:hypothetical protein WJX82_009033 [Trebouxia sp. C0006]
MRHAWQMLQQSSLQVIQVCHHCAQAPIFTFGSQTCFRWHCHIQSVSTSSVPHKSADHSMELLGNLG